MDDVMFYIQDDVLFVDEPIYGYKNRRRISAVITKEAFIDCYKKWISEDALTNLDILMKQSYQQGYLDCQDHVIDMLKKEGN